MVERRLMGRLAGPDSGLVRASRSSNGLVLKAGSRKRISDCTQRDYSHSESALGAVQGGDRLRVRMHYESGARLLCSRVHGEIAMPPVAHTGAYELILTTSLRRRERTRWNSADAEQNDLVEKWAGFADPNDALNYVTGKKPSSIYSHHAAVGVEAYLVDADGCGNAGRSRKLGIEQQFPEGMAALGTARMKGSQFLLWFDPEGVAPGSMIEKEHPGWVLHQSQEGDWAGCFVATQRQQRG